VEPLFIHKVAAKHFFHVTPTNRSLKISFEIRATWLQERPIFLKDTQGLLFKEIKENNTLHFWVGLGAKGHISLMLNTILKLILF
jgi:hypothetical protein